MKVTWPVAWPSHTVCVRWHFPPVELLESCCSVQARIVFDNSASGVLAGEVSDVVLVIVNGDIALPGFGSVCRKTNNA